MRTIRSVEFVVLGFPSDNFNNQEFDDIEKTMEFCEINYGVTFPMFAKVDVKGDHADPLFKFLMSRKEGYAYRGNQMELYKVSCRSKWKCRGTNCTSNITT